MKYLFLFDVDGTLTIPCDKITNTMLTKLEYLSSSRNIDIGFVGGSNLDKQKYQIGEENFHLFKWRFSENGLIAFKDTEVINESSFKDFMGEHHFMKFINIVLKNLSNVEIPKKRGTFIEFRNGMLNVSPIGRACSRAERREFEEYDKQNNIRKILIENIKKDWKNYCYFDDTTFHELENINFSIGGQISFDVFPKGWDKTYCLKFVEHEYDEIHFFGDKTNEGGNDYEIYNDSRVIGHHVNSYVETMHEIENILNKIETQ